MRYKNFNFASRSEEKSIWFLATSVGLGLLRPLGHMCFVSHLNLLIQLLYDEQTSLIFLLSVVRTNDLIFYFFNESFGTRMEPRRINDIFVQLYSFFVFFSLRDQTLEKQRCEQTAH